MSKKLNELTEKTGQLDQNDLMLVSSNNVSKSVKVSTLEAPLKQYATDKANEALSTAQSEIEAEESRALAAESSLQSQISAEISSRQLAVSAEATSRSSSISAEQSRAETIEASLQSQIDAEISRAQAAEALKADSYSVYTKTESNANYEPKNSNIQTHVVSTSNPHEVTKAQVGLGNVDNTSDLNKPVSTATQTAIAAGDATTLASANTYTDNKNILSLVPGESLLVNAAVYISPASDATRTAGRAYKINAGTASRSNCVGVVKSLAPSVSPILSEDFESNSFATNGWTVASNAAGANKWEIGSFSKNSGTYGAYISNSGNTGNNYTNTSSSVSHFYRNISIPSVAGPVLLSFVYKFTGESTSSVKYDFLTIAVDPTLATPSTSTISSSSSLTTPSGGLRKTYLTTNNAWTTDSVDLSAYKGQTIRLVFSWYNDSTSGTNPPVSIDSILLTEYAQIQVQTSGILSGFSGLTQGSIYYAGADGSLSTTAGSSPVPVGVAMSTTELFISTSSSLSSEISRALTAEASLQTALSTEVTRAQAAESSLQSSLTTTSNLATSTYNLTTAVSNSLDAEITRAQAAENLIKTPVGTIITSITNVAPAGYLECNGKPVSRTTYADLFSIMGTSHGSGNGSTTFNLPDLQGMFLRGAYYQNYLNIGGAASNNFTLLFENTSIWRTGTKLRLAQGTVTGLSTGVDYYYIYINNSTFAVASTFANALTGVKITVSSPSINASLIQYEDPDVTSRTNYTLGSNITVSAGSMQNDSYQGHYHRMFAAGSTSGTGSNAGSGGSAASYTSSVKESVTDGTNGTPRTSSETRPKNISVFYHIKF